MTEVVSIRVNEDVKRRLVGFARRRGFVHPSQRANISAAARECIEYGLRVIEASGVGGANATANR